MIGGEDILIELPCLAPSMILPAAVRYVLGRWPTGVTQDGGTGRRFDRFAAMNFGKLREVFVYRDEQALHSWERLGADPSNANQMVHLLASSGRLTIVVDDLQDIVSASIVRGLQDLFRFGLPWSVDMEAA
jgi:hypothetical protein